MKITEITDKFPTVVDVEEMSRRCHVSAKRLIELADAGLIPHLRVDGGLPLFRSAEARQWVAENLLKYHEGKKLPVSVVIVRDRPEAIAPPRSLKFVEGLMDISDIVVAHSGIYFLCKRDEVMYVGQSVKVGRRVHAHVNVKEFDRILFMRWPVSDLDALEGALIRALDPPLNRTSQNILLAPGDKANDAEVLRRAGWGQQPTTPQILAATEVIAQS